MIDYLSYLLCFIVGFAYTKPLAQGWGDLGNDEVLGPAGYPGGECFINKARGIWVPWKGNYCEKGVTDFNTRSMAPRGSMHYVDYMCCVKVACQRKTYGDSAFCVISWSGTSYPQWNKLPDCPKLYKRVEDTEQRCQSTRTDEVFVDHINQYNPIPFEKSRFEKIPPHCCAPIDIFSEAPVDGTGESDVQPQQIGSAADGGTAPANTVSTEFQATLPTFDDETEQESSDSLESLPT